MRTVFAKRTLFVSLGLIAATLLVYWRVADYGFIQNYDDAEYITQNPFIQQGLTWKGITWAFTTGYAANWHPLTWISHTIDIQLFGLHPAGHHLVSLFFHLINTILLFTVLNRMTKGFWQSAFVAAVFALHPLHVESVAWIAERKDVLSTLFWLLTMWTYHSWTERPSLKRYGLIMVCLVLGLMTKPMLVTLPLVLLLLDYWPLRRLSTERNKGAKVAKGTPSTSWSRIRPLVVEKIPLLVVALASSASTFLVQQQYTAVQSADVFPMSSRIINGLTAYSAYIFKTIRPADLAVYYPHHGLNTPLLPAIASAGFLIVISTIVVYLRQRNPYLIVGWLWYLGTLVPVIGLIQVGAQAMADRYMYVPMVGLLIMVAWGSRDITLSWPHRKTVLAIASGSIAVILLELTNSQIAYWRDSATLFQRAVGVTTGNWLAHNNLGQALFQQGRADEAIGHYNEAIRISPTNVQPHINLAVAYDSRGETEKALTHYLTALSLNNNLPDVHCNAGIDLYRQGKVQEAISHYNEVLRIDPNHLQAHVNLASALAALGRVDEAIAHYGAALRINNTLPDIHYNIAVYYHGQGKITEAISHYQEALRLKPDYVQAHNNLGSIRYNQGRMQEAIDEFSAALKFDPGFSAARSNLEAARAALGSTSAKTK